MDSLHSVPFMIAAAGSTGWPFLVLIIGMVFVITLIAFARVHAFVALILAAILVGFLSPSLPGAEEGSRWIRAVELPMEEFGRTAGTIAWVIGLASIIGLCLMESGAADRIVRQLIRWLGEQRAGWALMICAFILGIPVFFDTVFFLLLPLAQALSFRLGKQYILFVTAIFTGAVITHSLVPPTPGPLVMADSLNLNLGKVILLGLLAGIVPACVAMAVGRKMDARLNFDFKSSMKASIADLKAVVSKDERELPAFWVSILPVALPVALIALSTCVDVMGGVERFGGSAEFVAVMGNKNIAMFIGAAIALYMLAVQKRLSVDALGESMGRPLATAGVIILITAAGGAFGAMIRHAGVGDAIKTVSENMGISLIVVSWLVAVVMKIAQGSGTVSMITTSAIMASIVGDGSGLAYDAVYLYMAIGFGSLLLSWMNDSGFWVVCKLSGFTEKETLSTWSLTLGIIATVGFVQTLLFSMVLPWPMGR